ncbi:peptide N-acetyl-beta-D-glucosaminyl asparaginase amidase A-domain-containing protein [Coprinopsis sp. MPI-PUGE-AT-0042]|nr:peptide N-acetyl-beta-D-glucosaminyl asparaginase amidase A-domain-containing protein [Coprinopsis sp. MPI-PUGE-AT-0042]
MQFLLFAFLLAFTGWTLAEPLVNFQVAQPPAVPKNGKKCTVRLIKRDFAFSYGSPEAVPFSPPTDCGAPGSWAAITLNFTSSINGTQYDRLGIFTFQNVEIWRMTTSQPLRGDGVVWSYVKDVTKYTPLFAKPGTFVLQLDNIVQPGLDGVFATTVDATFYASSRQDPPAKKANVIIPLSTLKPNEGNHASVPPAFSLNVTLPRNAVQVYAELHASGNGEEEFWYLNAANQFFGSIPPDTTYGQGPFREVRLLVDGRLAGTAFPYATIFTGGYVPAAWKPIPAYPAHDLPTYFIDLTPFIPLLVDGQPHNFTLDVASAEEDHAILQNWYVSGILQVFTSESPKPTTGRIIKYNAEPYAESRTSGNVNTETGVDITVDASRKLSVESEIIDGNGKRNHVSWSQQLSFSNKQKFSEGGFVMEVSQSTTGRVTSTHNGVQTVLDSFNYPLALKFTVSNGGSGRKLEVDHAYERDLLPMPVITRSKTFNHQVANGLYTIASTGNFGNGTNSNEFSYSDARGNTYRRKVDAAFNNITLDVESGTLASNRPAPWHLPTSDQPTQAMDTARFPAARRIGA